MGLDSSSDMIWSIKPRRVSPYILEIRQRVGYNRGEGDRPQNGGGGMFLHNEGKRLCR